MKINQTPPTAFMFNGKKATKAILNGKVVWTSGGTPTPPDPPQPTTGKYIALTVPSGNYQYLERDTVGYPPSLNLEYSYDTVTWTRWGRYDSLDMGEGKTLYIRGKNANFSLNANAFNYLTFGKSAVTVEVTGDLTALLDYDTDLQTLPQGCFAGLFYDCHQVTKVPALPDVTTPISCYSRIFEGCTRLSEVTVLSRQHDFFAMCYNWLVNAAPTGTIYVPDTTLYDDNGSNIPTGWTRVNM